jgi:YesN/AraC family two-component response regulator/DNA-binding Xre family transcriptional regulator
MAGEKILIVDDEKTVREVFVSAFDEYRLVLAENGEQALKILKQPHDIDLIVLDMKMPGLSGKELIEEIKKISPEQKMVILTGYGSKEVVVDALRLDVDDFIDKPFDLEETKKVFDRILSERDNFYDNSEIDSMEGKMKQAKVFIERNYNKAVSLKDVADELFLSPKYFSRVFKEKTGKTFNEYKIEFRIEMARKMLRETNATISQIAYKVGYHNPESFIKIFKKVTSEVPSEYREKMKKEKRGITLGDRIKKIRLHLAVNQREIAKKSNITVSFLSQVEKNKAIPSLKSLKNIADALGVKISKLLNEEALQLNKVAIINKSTNEKIVLENGDSFYFDLD